MKRLLVLRHAQALPAEGGNDIDRALSPKGLSDALALGETIKKRGYVPDRVLCSAAKRTQQTCEELIKGLDTDIHTEFTNAIYSARIAELMQMVQETDDKVQSLLVIGHNPTIYELAVKLSIQGHETSMNHLMQGYPPASLSIIEADIEHWGDIKAENCKLLDLLDPLDYNAPAAPTRWT
ncbi:MAG: histidine phosphatase family protein [Pseudomonadota bacterium]